MAQPIRFYSVQIFPTKDFRWAHTKPKHLRQKKDPTNAESFFINLSLPKQTKFSIHRINRLCTFC
jgi:hypothetical protein